jgi:aldehyde:ferredoxin oxidoreductase
MDQPQNCEYLLTDLTEEHSERHEISPEVLRDYPSGVGLATYLLDLHMPTGTDPLAEESVIVISTGFFAGLPYPGGTRFAIAGKSPLTHCWAGGTMGGEFAWALPRSGTSTWVIKGCASDWSYLFLDEGRLFFRPAAPLLGKSLDASKRELKEIWGREIAVLGIGPSGEDQVRFASISDGSPERGVRGGLGAIFGSKKLKALVIRPHRGVTIEQTDDFLDAAAPLIKSLGTGGNVPVVEMGSPLALKKLNEAQALPIHNFNKTGFDGGWFDALDHLEMKKRACIGCPISCVRLYLSEEASGSEPGQTLLPLFPEQIWALGPLMDVTDMGSTLQGLRACLKHGLDPISMGVVAAWAAECFEKGIDIGLDLGGEAGFGNGGWTASLPDRVIADPHALGLLGMGVYKAAEKAGPNAMELAVHFCGQELSYMDPRRAFLPLSYLGPALDLTANGSFKKSISSAQAWASEMIRHEDRWALLETLGICQFASAAQEDLMGTLACFCEFVTGSAVSPEDLTRWGQRCVKLIKAFDWREGRRPLNLNLSEKFFKEDLIGAEDAFPALDLESYQVRMGTYFSQRGWSSEGEPLEILP